jgi:4-amino-4-deoxy-L-arabinose transferase-like glycosyltransferase
MTDKPDFSVESADARWIWVLVIGLVVLLCFRLLALATNGTDLFFDEAQYWAWGQEPAFGYYSKPPLIGWIIGAASASCGNGEFCVRLPSPLIHTATAIAVFFLGRQLYDTRTGALSGLAFATLPGVSLSAGLISTDVPLLLCWAIALAGFAALFNSRGIWPALVLGLAFGIGLNAKYAMAWFLLCLSILLVMAPERRTVLKDYRLYAGLGLGLLLILPNLVWNYTNSFATFSHTADNAKWAGSLLHPVKALEFFVAQFGVFGPILFGSLLVIVWRAWKQRLPESDRLLIAFSVPIIAVITVQALISRAHANWAATAYVAASVLVVATMVRDGAWGWLKGSFVVNVAAMILIAVGTITAGQITLPFTSDPFARILGWRAVAEATQAELAKARSEGQPFAAVITRNRAVTAELLYYMRDEPTPVLAWRRHARPRDHFEMTRPLTSDTTGRVLLVVLGKRKAPSDSVFATSEKIGDRELPAGNNAHRRVTFYALSGYKGR